MGRALVARRWLLLLTANVVLAGFFLYPTYASAQASCADKVGRFVSVSGSVDLQRRSGGEWLPAKLDRELCEGDTIRVGERSRAAVALINEAVLRIDERTTVRLTDITGKKEERSWLDLIEGAFQSFSRKPRFLTVNTPYLNGSIEGTEFLARVDGKAAEITVFEGVVQASNDQGEVQLKPGESARATVGAAPQRRILVKPRDQVQWSLYYPPILSAASVARSPSLGEAASCAAKGNTVCAFAALEKVPAAKRDANFHLLRASLLLSVGRVAEATTDIDEALRRDPSFGQAYALRSVIEVTQNQKDKALTDARRGVELSPDSAAAEIALSYALQADFQIPAARDTMRSAVEQQPNDSLAWARLAELELMLGDRVTAITDAKKAKAIDPGLSRTELVLGFNALAVFRNDEAKLAFERAITLDSADPLAHLGLGLAKISDGKLGEGTSDLEAAVALDSSNALLRAYLGKAYFEERRWPLDSEQYSIAKQLDPNDPTAYLYDGILKQTINRPVDAVADLRRSIELNDNRAVYRSRLLLDKDRAARGTSLARAYNDLGFEQLGINEAMQSLAIDPSNGSAHRFLSDAYLDAPRHETARISELQQAQMLQTININPIQPSLREANLNIVTQGGPANPGFDEFTPLFEQNRAQLNLSLFGGTNNTIGGETVVSRLYDQVSLSAGAFGYDTDGYRPNNDLRHELYNVFGQIAITPAINVQAEYQQRNSKYGDLAMNFDPELYLPNQRSELDTESFWLGTTLRPYTNSTILLLYNHKKAKFSRSNQTEVGFLPSPPFSPDLPPILLVEDTRIDATSDQFEGNYIFQADMFNVLVGVANTDVNREDTAHIVLQVPNGPAPTPLVEGSFDGYVQGRRGYIYGNVNLPSSVTWTLGLTYQQYEEDLYDLDETLPKFGVVWNLNETLQFRGAYFKVMKPVLASNRTLEPTQIAGFNQFFDDLDATRSTRYGVGADWQPNGNIALGLELSKRVLTNAEATVEGYVSFVDRDEWTDFVYLYWTPNSRWAIGVRAVYDKFLNDPDSLGVLFDPESVRTVTVPITVTYFHPSGLFGGFGVTYVDQRVRRIAEADLPQGDSSFGIVDLAVGCRLPKRRGVVSLGVQNLLDRDFEYQDNSYREFGDEPSVSPYVPDRLIMAKLVLSF
jgi:tetratricopeptide (TPR) repeat protein